ncbi:DNA polymerase beta superfamily protein [Parapedobacter sp. GCM10030251]|uniref:DNA polymerase beta superfamily protein n=1 Tax=Parapedobacter sp. GCM10030251 TaxID=3273419 RepID=UPI0036224100
MTIQALRDSKLILFEAVSGSKAYGLDTATSDTDVKGVFYLPKEQFYGLEYIGQVSNESNDEVFFELGRFVELACKSNPNILELLASPSDCIRYRHPVMDLFPLELFLSRRAKDTFAAYAITQVRKAKGLNKKIHRPFPKERRGILDFCHILNGYGTQPLTAWLAGRGWKQQDCGLTKITHTKGLYALFHDANGALGYKGIAKDAVSNEVSLSSIPKGEQEQGYLFFNKEAYSTYCKAHKEYWEWVDRRNEVRYTSTLAHGKGYDTKNLMHTIRLLQMAEELMRTGTLTVKRGNREELLAIKAGAHTYEALMDKADRLIERLNTNTDNTLPLAPQQQIAVERLVAARTTLYGS